MVAQGQTLGEAMEIAQDVAKELILSYLAHGDVLPPKIQAALQKQPLAMKSSIPITVSGMEIVS